MSRVINPYFAGPPATQPETFFGREDVLQFVDDTLSSPMHNALVFYGQRRIGKTSILHQIARRKSQDYQAIFFDLQSSVDSPVEELLFGLARAIAGQLKIMAPSRADFKNDAEFFRTVFLPHVYQQLGQKRLLLLLDEFDALSVEIAPTELDALPFVKALNRIIQSDDRQVVFLFVVGRRLKDLSANQLQIFRGALDRQISLLRREACIQLITRPAQGVLSFSDGAIDRIWSLTSGQPYFTQLICHKIFNDMRRQNVWIVTGSHVETVLDDVIGAGQTALRWFWNEVPLVERFILYTIGKLAAGGVGVSLEQLLAERDSQRVQVPDLEVKAIPDKLVDRQVLIRDEQGRYHFAVEVVRRWIVQTHSAEEVKSELTRVAVDESAKDFFRAGRAAYLNNDDTDFAVDSFGRALGINPDYVEARLWLARTRLKAGDVLAAIDEFTYVERYGGKEATDARVGLADARAEYGQQLEAERKIDAAKQEYQRVLKLDEQHLVANSRLSEIYRQEADKLLDEQGILAAQPLYELAVEHKTDQELERQIRDRLEQYSRAQAANYHWQAAEQARHLANQISQAEDDYQALLRVRLEWGRWLLDKQEFDEAAGLYRRLLAESGANSPREMIETDLLRYNQQAEDETNWPRAEASLGILAGLFPDDTESQSRLAESLCRQGEFYLSRGDLAKSKAAYQRVRAIAAASEAVEALIREGFQAYYRNYQTQNTVAARTAVVEAMLVQVEILGSDDPQAYEQLLSARESLGDVLRQENNITQAHEVYLHAWDDVTHTLQLSGGSSPIFHHRAALGLKLGLVELDRGAFREATESLQQALADTQSDPKMVHQIKTTFFDYRYRQEEMLRWGQAENAMAALRDLFPDDEEVGFALAETRAAQAEWDLQRAIPDLEAARRFAQAALEVDLLFVHRDLIATRIKDSFVAFCELQESAAAPKWPQAEYAMNSLVSFFPGDTALHHRLGELRVAQGNWYLAQEEQAPVQIRNNLLRAADAYKRALSDLPRDRELLDHIKDSFRAYRELRWSTWPQARSAIETLAEALPDDEEIQRWLDETEPKKPPVWPKHAVRWVPIAVILIAIVVSFGVFRGVQTADTATPIDAAALTDLVSTPSPLPTTEPSPTLTITPVLPTEEPSSVQTIDLEPTTETPPTPTDTLIPTITPTPTAILTPTPYPPPQLVRPNNGFEYIGASSLPQLEWNPVGELGDNEFYRVRYTSPQGQIGYTTLLADPGWEMPVAVFHWANLLPLDPAEQTIDWQVQVVREENGELVELSVSETRTFAWHPKSLPEGKEALDVAVNPDNALEILAILKDEGVYRTENGGLSWNEVWGDPSAETLHITPATPRIIYAGVFGHILRSEDNGKNWEPLRIQVGTQPLNAQVNSITSDPNNATIIFVATDKGALVFTEGVWKSLDREGQADGPVLNDEFHSIVATTNRVYAAGSGDRVFHRNIDDFVNPWASSVCSPSCTSLILSMAVDPTNANKLLVGSEAEKIAVSVNGQNQWQSKMLNSTSSKDLDVSAIVINPLNPQIIFAGTGTFDHPTNGEGLYQSLDGGETWLKLDNTIDWAYIQSIALDPQDSQKIYIAGSKGVYYSPDLGVTWIKL